jgi:hypothetical protein
MAKPKPENSQPEPPPIRLLPMELQIGDRVREESGDWEVIRRPYSSAGGKIASAHVRKVGRPEVTELRSWGAHERLSVKRATAEEGKR